MSLGILSAVFYTTPGMMAQPLPWQPVLILDDFFTEDAEVEILSSPIATA